MKRFCKLICHQCTDLIQLVLVSALTDRNMDSMILRKLLRLVENIGNFPICNLDQTSADIQTAHAAKRSLLIYRDIRRAAADIKIGYYAAVLLRKDIRSRAPRCKH